MVIPNVAHRLACLQGTYGIHPSVDVVKSVTMAGTSTRETHEAGLHVSQYLSQIGAHTILASLERLLWEERNHVQSHLSYRRGNHQQLCLVRIPLGGKDGVHLLPLARSGCREVFLSHGVALLINKAHGEFSCLSFQLTSPQGEVVLVALLQYNTVKSFVGKGHTRLADGQCGIVLVVFVNRIISGYLKLVAISGILQAPSRRVAPSPTMSGVRRVILEATVLHQLGIDTSIGSIVDVFEKHTDEFVTDGLCLDGRSQCQLCLHGLQSFEGRNHHLLAILLVLHDAVLVVLHQVVNHRPRYTLHVTAHFAQVTIQVNGAIGVGIRFCHVHLHGRCPRFVIGRGHAVLLSLRRIGQHPLVALGCEHRILAIPLSVRVTLPIPVGQVGRRGVCKHGHGFTQAPHAMPPSVVSLRHPRCKHPFLRAPSSEVALQVAASVANAHPVLPIGTIGKVESQVVIVSWRSV